MFQRDEDVRPARIMNQLEEAHEDDFDPTAKSWFIPIGLAAVSSVETVAPHGRSRSEQLHELSLLLHQLEPVEKLSASNESRIPAEPNHRQYSRCPIVEEKAAGVLTLNGRRFDCQIAELSIGGFGVIVAGRRHFKQGTVGNLRTPGLNYVVSVTRLEARADGVFVALKQLEEIVDHQLPSIETSPIVRYLIAGLSGALIAMTSIYFMNGR